MAFGIVNAHASIYIATVVPCVYAHTLFDVHHASITNCMSQSDGYIKFILMH